MKLQKNRIRNSSDNFTLSYFKKTDYNYICTIKSNNSMKQGIEFHLTIEKIINQATNEIQ